MIKLYNLVKMMYLLEFKFEDLKLLKMFIKD